MGDKQRSQRFKSIVTAITLAALAVLAYAIRHQLDATIKNFARVNAWLVLLIIPWEMLNYLSQAKLYQHLFRVFGDRFRTKPMYRLALELNFINNVFPSGGVSGFSYISLRLKNEHISTAKATLVQLMKLISLFIAFQILLFVGLLALAIGGQANDITILVAGSLFTLLVVATAGLAFIVGSKSRINNFFGFVTKVLNKVIHIFRPSHPETFNIEQARSTFTELHENYMQLRSNLTVLKKPLLFALGANATEVAAIYSVYLAFGHWVNPGAVILAYAVANFAGLISVLPGGVGIYEALMTAVLAAGGIPPSLSLPVTIMYRVVNMSIQLPPGYYFYHKALHAKPHELEQA